MITLGRLTVIDADGRRHVYEGEPVSELVPVTLKIHDPKLYWTLALRPTLVAGEAYMDGTLTVEEGTLYDFLALAGENLHRMDARYSPGERLASFGRFFQQWNPVRIAKKNVSHHYDLSDALYNLFLDEDRQYSCAYFATPDTPLDEAQKAKKRHIMAKLLLEPGQKVLDIGCGWGGLALSIAREVDCEVTGITLSEEQLKVARRRAEEAQLAHKVQFLLCDYRELTGKFDRIVSVGMFEHVGVTHYRTFFNRVRDLLTENGVALLHSIGRAHGSGSTNPWIRKYIFPGGYTPALSEVMPAIERAELYTTDIELLYPHYADTLRQWSKRFAERRSEAVKLYDERFCRMWEFYLAGSESAFRHLGQMVFQIQMSKGFRSVPRIRDYIRTKEQTYLRA
jgi:cyclopropane-fatty-acyl-phospholipid synthase